GKRRFYLMKRIFVLVLVLAAVFVNPLTNPGVWAQSRPTLSAEWIFSEPGRSVAAIPRFQWLAGKTAILYDIRQPESIRTFERYDPGTQKRQPVLEMSKAVASLQS